MRRRPPLATCLRTLLLAATLAACSSATSPHSSTSPDAAGGAGSRGAAGAGGAGGSGGAGGAAGASGSAGAGGSGGSPQDSGAASGAWILGYFSNWEDADNGGAYSVDDVDWDVVTHVAAAFYVPDGKGGFDPGNFDAKLAAPLIAAAHAHGRKAIASIGGAGSGPVFESSMQAGTSTKFLASLQALLTSGYDGLDIDWEEGNLSPAMDQALETSLIGSLRATNPTAILTMTAGYEDENAVDDLSFYGAIAPELDRINLMTYGMSGAWQGWKSWHSAPLHWNKDTSTPTGIDASVAHYLAAGVPAAKLGVGAGFYGECYTSPVTAPVQALAGAKISASDGVMSYAHILASYYDKSAYHYDSQADVPFLTLDGKNAKGCTFVTYEDTTSVAAKAAWVKAQGLGAIILWTLGEGFEASGASVADKNPLVEAMKSASP